MIDANDLMTSYQNHQKALAEANLINKGAVFDALAALAITSVIVEFDGAGDSGQIESVIASAGETRVILPGNPVTLRHASWENHALRITQTVLPEAIETLCYSYLQQEYGGWENNDGAFGNFEFDIVNRTIQFEFNGRFTDVSTTNHSF
jgi:hypothetical protein